MKVWSSVTLTSPTTQPRFTTASPTRIRTKHHTIHYACCSSASQTGTYLHCLGKKMLQTTCRVISIFILQYFSVSNLTRLSMPQWYIQGNEGKSWNLLSHRPSLISLCLTHRIQEAVSRQVYNESHCIYDYSILFKSLQNSLVCTHTGSGRQVLQTRFDSHVIPFNHARRNEMHLQYVILVPFSFSGLCFCLNSQLKHFCCIQKTAPPQSCSLNQT